MDAINIAWFKFFAIEFYDVLFGFRGRTIPSIVNIEYDFQNFTHQVTNPLFIGSKTQTVKYEGNKIYKLEHQDVEVKVGKEVVGTEWFWNDMFELTEGNLYALANNTQSDIKF
jgi:hypothetical protein